MSITMYDIDIVKIKPTSARNRVIAQAEILVAGVVRIKGIKIQKSQYLHPRFQEQIQIEPPSIRWGSSWMNVVYIEDVDLWSEIEEAIYNKFLKLKIDYESLEKINLDEIPENLGKIT